MSGSEEGGARARLLRGLLRLVGIGLVAFFVYQVVAGLLARTGEATLVPGAWALLVTLGGLGAWYLALELASEWVLRTICAPGRGVRWLRTATAYFQHLLARYVPGKVWIVPARTEALVDHGIARHESVRSIVYEQLHFLSASAVLGVLVLAAYPEVALGGVDVGWIRIGLALVSVGILLSVAWPTPLFRLVRSAFGAVLTEERLDALDLEVSPWRWRVAFLLYFGVVVLQGAVLYPLVLDVLPGDAPLSPAGWLIVLGSYPVARLVGQLSLVVPSGIGVREGAYVLLTLPVLDGAVAAVVVVWVRLLSVTAELLWYGVLTLARIRRGRVEGSGGAAGPGLDAREGFPGSSG